MTRKNGLSAGALRKTIFGVPGENGKTEYGRAHWIYVYVVLALMGIAVGLVSLLLTSSIGGIAMFISYFKKPLILVLNILPCILIMYLVFFATGRAWISFSVTSVLIFAMSLVDYYKLQIRNDPFYAVDFSLFGEAQNIVSQYELNVSGKVLLVFFALIFGIAFSALFMKGVYSRGKVRAAGAALTLIVSALMYFLVYSSDTVYENYASNEENINVWSETQQYVSRGFVYPFLYSVKEAFPSVPEGYDEEQAEEVLSQYVYSDIDEDKKVNVISVMLEAYSDFSVYDSIEFTEDIYEPVHEIMDESYSGTLISNVFGGGTIDTERAFITGYDDDDEYRSNVNSYVWYMKEQGYITEGLHPGENWFYNRQNINSYLGFDNYYFLQDYEDPLQSDEFFFSQLTTMYEEGTESGNPYFSFSVSYQNHGAYPDDATTEPAYISGDGLSEQAYNVMNNYFTGIYDTNIKIAQFVDSFRESDEPVVIVMFGDHKPWLGDGDYAYNELDINIDVSTEEGFYNYYSTPYFIWANDAAKTALGNDFTGEGETLSACFLMNKLFDLCSWEGNEYMQFTDSVMAVTPIVNNATDFYCFDGTVTGTVPENKKELVQEYDCVQYYMKNNFLQR